jgi:amino acid adenylation domain-containing protein
MLELATPATAAALRPRPATAIPRWTLDPVPGVAEHELPIPGELVDALHRVADDVVVPFSSVLLAAHAKVLAAVSGDREVATGYLAVECSPTAACRLTLRAGSWRDLLLEACRAERERGQDEIPVETSFDPVGCCSDLGPDTVLCICFPQCDGKLVARLRYRTDALDADAAARIAGYHLTALELIGADPGARHDEQSLLSAEELGLQVEGMAGPPRELPDRRFHELFEERVETHPDAVAAMHGDEEWTYRELNARANRLGRALLARGLRREGVVAVVTERNLDWMAAVIAVFKAGGVYLPIEPHFPADRIAATLSRAGCELVLTEPDNTRSLDQALASLSGVERILIGLACRETHSDGDLGVEVSPGQLAYIYFTSGSTGEPKGAMCEHAGTLNHLYAKIDDLEIGAGQVVAQTAPQCFDISLWQLVSGPLVGGRTLIVEQDVILDVERFVDRIAGGRVAVLQVVPSYLEVVLTYLDQHPRELPDLRFVSVTGEALKPELARRWFDAQPGIKLVNAYGLTETSDDTNHEVMDRAPDGERVPLGPPVAGVHVYVVDEQLAPVPLGAPGEIVFSGVCVGRGYVNDPDRTRRAFMADPHRDGQRLYRAGDFGRWLPDGKLEFLGRRDGQVKIRGFRIEIGEIESTLARVAGVESAVVVSGGRQLVAFHCGDVAADALRGRLADALPQYMVPSTFHRLDRLPLTGNGKVDKKALGALAEELDAPSGHLEAPATPSEQRVAAAWAEVLGVAPDQIGRRDSFFDLGGTSLTAVKLVIALDRELSLKDVTRSPVLAGQARLLDAGSAGSAALLQRLSGSDGAGALVCFPYAGGNAVNFQPLAEALRGSGLAVYAVELPGHDVADSPEPFAPIAEVVDRVVAEIASRGLESVLLWGHSSGTPLAVETARKLEELGVEVPRVFLAAHLPGDPGERHAAAAELERRDAAEIAAELSSDGGYGELGELDAERAEHASAAYRHDCVAAHRWFAAPPATKLSAPVTVVVAADDPATDGHESRHRDWQGIAEHVDLHELADGGHYFLRTRPTEAARAVWHASRQVAPS